MKSSCRIGQFLKNNVIGIENWPLVLFADLSKFVTDNDVVRFIINADGLHEKVLNIKI